VKSKSFERLLFDGELVVMYKIRDKKSIIKIMFKGFDFSSIDLVESPG